VTTEKEGGLPSILRKKVGPPAKGGKSISDRSGEQGVPVLKRESLCRKLS